MATIPGVIHGKTIELERESGLPEGQQVAVCNVAGTQTSVSSVKREFPTT